MTNTVKEQQEPNYILHDDAVSVRTEFIVGHPMMFDSRANQIFFFYLLSADTNGVFSMKTKDVAKRLHTTTKKLLSVTYEKLWQSWSIVELLPDSTDKDLHLQINMYIRDERRSKTA
jgi:hypothetical protein